ncbi:hypothetical protein [Spirosoma jeollabukense]
MNKAISNHVQSAGCALCLRRQQCAGKQLAAGDISEKTARLTTQKSGSQSIKSPFQLYKNHAGTTL